MPEFIPIVEFVPFRFKVSLYEKDIKNILCQGMFSEVSGLEVTMEPKVIAEGGSNWGEKQRVGPTRFSPIVLKRGVTDIMDLWTWFDSITRGANYGNRLQGEIEVLGPELGKDDLLKPIITWKLTGVLPTRFKGPDLSSVANQVAIEELTLVHEGLTMKKTTA